MGIVSGKKEAPKGAFCAQKTYRVDHGHLHRCGNPDRLSFKDFFLPLNRDPTDENQWIKQAEEALDDRAAPASIASARPALEEKTVVKPQHSKHDVVRGGPAVSESWDSHDDQQSTTRIGRPAAAASRVA